MTSRAVVLLLLAGCFTPVAEPCRSRTRCGADGGTNECSTGSTRACGSAIGICKPGKQTCGQDRQWGKCTGAVEQGVEVCDGLDNNCDGVVDEGVAKMCPLQKGVCAGAAAACGGPSDAGTVSDAGATCAMAYGPKYEAVESSCDGFDNDCDGLIDRTAPQNLSQSVGVVSRKPVAVKVPGSDAVLVLWEEGQKVAARVARADGTLSPVVAPSVTVEASTKSWAPAVAVNGTLIVAAWAEEVAAAKRVMVASLDVTTGRSDLMGAGALLASSAADPTDISIAVDPAAGRILISFNDGSALRVLGFSSTLPPPMGSPTFMSSSPGYRRCTLSAAGGGNFTLAFDAQTGGVTRAVFTSASTSILDPTTPMGQNAHLFVSDGGVSSYFLGGSSTAKQVLKSPCVLIANTLTCSPATAMTDLADIDALRVAEATLAAWQKGVSSPTVLGLWLDRADAGIEAGPGKRPWPVITSNRAVLTYDTEGIVSTLVDSDEVYLVRVCR